MYANHRHYILFTLAFVTFIVTALGYAYMRQRVYQQAVRSAELTKQVKLMEDKKKHDMDITKASSKLSEEQDIINSYIVPKDKIVDFIEVVEKIGNETSTKLELSSIATAEIVKGKKIEDNFTTLKARIDVVGTWANVMRAFTLIENLPFSLSVSNIKLNEGSGSAALPEAAPIGTTTKAIVKQTKTWSLAFDIKVLILDKNENH